MNELLMGNEAIALGALAAGVQLVAGYPGTPSTEVLETVAARNPGGVWVEWSVNEKAAMEVAAGAAYSGAKALVTMKQVGLNVATDPLMCVNYIGVKGALVIFVADDPGPISSQTEQDSRHFGKYAKIPVFDCTSPEEAFCMIQDAFACSQQRGTPVIFRATTRICHSCASIEVPELGPAEKAPGFERSPRWVIFPRLSFESKKRLEAQEIELGKEFSTYPRNELRGSGPIGIACGGDSYAYVMQAIEGREENYTVLKVATPYPFPEDLAQQFLSACERVLVFEELDPVLEDALVLLCGRRGLTANIRGKRCGAVPNAGELSAEAVAEVLTRETGAPARFAASELSGRPAAPARPPVLCAGCPHRASFYAVKQAMAGRRAVFCGDIGCYTLGNAMPLDMVDTCLCMGAGITVAQGIWHEDPEVVPFAFVGDSTFFASGITGVVNAVYNRSELILIVLDNATTAMTGHQPHPGTGRTMMGEVSRAVSIPDILRAIGLMSVREVDPLDYSAAVAAVQAAAQESGVRAIVFRSPCVALVRGAKPMQVDAARCAGCQTCISELGCPALSLHDGFAEIDPGQCTGCGLCSQICPVGCIGKEEA